jgi:hypothetical protein
MSAIASPASASSVSLADTLRADLRDGLPLHRHHLLPTWDERATDTIVRLVLEGSDEPQALRSFRVASAYLWSCGSFKPWAQLTDALIGRFGLDDLRAVVLAASASKEPDDLGHLVCTAVYLDGAFGSNRIDPEVLLPLTARKVAYEAGYRSRRRLALRRSALGRTGVLDLLASNGRAAHEVGNAHDVAENLGDIAFVRRAERSVAATVEELRLTTTMRRFATGAPSTGQAQQRAAIALIDPAGDLDVARSFALAVRAHHVVAALDIAYPSDLLECPAAARAAALEVLARIW